MQTQYIWIHRSCLDDEIKLYFMFFIKYIYSMKKQMDDTELVDL